MPEIESSALRLKYLLMMKMFIFKSNRKFGKTLRYSTVINSRLCDLYGAILEEEINLDSAHQKRGRSHFL